MTIGILELWAIGNNGMALQTSIFFFILAEWFNVVGLGPSDELQDTS